MTHRGTDDLLRELVDDLVPVRRTPRLRSVGLAVAAIWGLAVVLEGALGGPRPDAASVWADPGHLTVMIALAIAAVGGIAGALAGAVPGRESLAGAGLLALGVGLAVALFGAVLSLLLAEAAPGAASVQALPCVRRAILLGIAPALVAALFLWRAFDRRPRRGALAATLGAISLGAVAVHASCVAGGPLHVLLGHALGPAAVALLLSLPLAGRLRRAAAR